MVFSVIIPAYNCEKTIARTVNSICAVGIEEMELIIVDDGSEDHTREECMIITKQYPFIRYYYQKNAGVSAARNFGIQQAAGEYILFWDSDDLADSEALRECMNKAIVQDVDVLAFGMICRRFYKEKIFQIENQCCKKEELILRSNFAERLDELFDINYLSSVCNKIIRREICQNLLFIESKMSFEDFLYSLHLLKDCNSIYIMPDSAYIYNINHSTGKPPREKRIEDFDLYMRDFQDAVLDLELTLGRPLLGLRKRILLIYGWLLDNKLLSSTLSELKAINKDKMRIILFGKECIPKSKVCRLFFDEKLFELRVYMRIRRIKRKIGLKYQCFRYKYYHSDGEAI